jgi:hypothetical protein
MDRENNADWRRAFFARLLGSLGTVCLAFTFLFQAVIPDTPWHPDSGKAKFILTIALPSTLLLCASLLLGRWKAWNRSYSSVRWHLAIPGTSYLVLALCICLWLLSLNVRIWLLAPAH